MISYNHIEFLFEVKFQPFREIFFHVTLETALVIQCCIY